MWNLDQLKQLVTVMNEYGNAESRQVEALEKDLATLGVGLPAHVEYKDRQGEGRIVIAYMRHGPKYRVCVAKGADCRPWLDWDRLTKVQTFPLLPDLIIALTAASERFITDHCEASKSPRSTAGTSATSATPATSPAPAG